MKEDQKRLRQEVRRLLEEAERVDAEEDARYGRNRGGDELPAELQRREATAATDSRGQACPGSQGPARSRGGSEEAGRRGQPAEVKPEEKDQYNFTDPESRMLKGPDGFLQGYNAQIAVEPGLQLIVGQAVTQAANDKQQLLPMVATVEEQAGQKPCQVLADSGYTSDASLQGMEKAKVDVYLAVARDKHHPQPGACPRGPLPRAATRIERMRRKLQTKIGRAIYAARKAIVEPVFGQIKQARGFRQFLLRGLEKVQGEWALVCMAHNILKLHRLVCT